MNNPIVEIRGRGLPLPGNDIDTDQMIESCYLKMTTFQGMEAHLFESTRRMAQEAGTPHPLDDPQYIGAEILLVNRNFGCGSSREHAPQAIRRAGFKAIIGESFGEIFAGNCVSLGLPCLQVSAAFAQLLQDIARRAPATALIIDLRQQIIMAKEDEVPFSISEGRRQRFLNGSWDSLQPLLASRAAVDQLLATLPPIRSVTGAARALTEK